MADYYDHSYRQLFSHPELIRDLLEGFVHEDWIKGLDLNTLEKVNGTYISDDLRRREDDIIWRVRLGGSWVYVYLLTEFVFILPIRQDLPDFSFHSSRMKL